jgi:predicted transcriptional regulator
MTDTEKAARKAQKSRDAQGAPGARDERRPAGELEAAVMAALWAADAPLTPGQVQAELAAGLARTTVTTILTRLHDKHVVGRTRRGRGYAYFPVQDAPGLTARRMHGELDRNDDRPTVLARFVDQLSPADGLLLRRLLEDADLTDAGSPETPSGP